jgi:hypothetical protein
MNKSPFIVFEDFISPNSCEKLISEFGILQTSNADIQVKNERILNSEEHIQMFKQLILENTDKIEKVFNAKVVGMEHPLFSQYFENPKNPAEVHGCENAKYLRKKWIKTKDVDLVGYIWLKDFCGGIPLDPRIEVYGGKLEFPSYNFSLVPQRGTLVLYPAGPHFITAISPIFAGSLEQIKITLKLKTVNNEMFIYQPGQFPGTYQEWFVEN